MISKLEQLIEALVKLDDRIGIKKFIKYLVVLGITISLIPVVKNPRESIKETVRFFIDLSIEVEGDKMIERDNLMVELDALLRELRAETGADRVVYYEYHNSIENEAGVPFKFCDLVQQAPKPGMPELHPLDNVNVSRFNRLYSSLKDNSVVVNCGDSLFFQKYPGASEISNGSVQQIYVNIPGVKLPLGLVVIEWYDSRQIDTKRVLPGIYNQATRINGLVTKLPK